jgi:hypothetical protein
MSTRPQAVRLARAALVEEAGISLFAYRAASSGDAFADAPALSDKRDERRGAA